ncbi:MAG: glycosyl hydrolase 53 family protein [Lachnospiraceae bacterium]|nr:glycosyl hydrolase 53 family protein [Lachnospiraceae bacterium]
MKKMRRNSDRNKRSTGRLGLSVRGRWSIAALCLALLMAMTALAGCGSATKEETGDGEDEADSVNTIATVNYIPTEKIEGSTLYVEKVENLADDFILGMDASSVISLENSGVTYRNFDGEEEDVFQILAENGVTHIRVRVWNDPYDEDGNGFGGGNCDVDTAIEIGKRATQVGMKLIIDFHYSDFWADPNKQMAPRAWEDMEIEEKTEAVYEFTTEALTAMKEAGVDVDIVQVGNETNGAMCGETIWFNIQYLMQAGSKATREVFPDAMVALHFANPETAGRYADYAKKLDYYDVDYDIFASSYYPFWHGTLENLAEVLSEVAETYGKKVMVMETSYAFSGEDYDFSGNTISDDSTTIVKDYPFSVQGQANSFRDVVDTIANETTNGIGVVYWEGTWISVGGSSWEENSALWEKYGSGWASSYAAVYDPDDAGKYYGGCAVDNQAFFDTDGNPFESLRIFNLVRYGNEVELKADAIDDVTLYVDLNGTVELPETVDAVMTDNSRQAVEVTWDITDEEIEAMYAGGVNTYTVTGEAAGMTATCYVAMIEYNFLTNYSFEDGDLTGWSVTDNAAADELYVEDKVTDSLTGTCHMHFWSEAQNTVDFDLEQTVEELPTGTYKYSISIMGGDAGDDQEVYAYVKIDGEIVATAPMTITSYGEWDTGTIEDITYEEGQEITVGIHVRCQGTGSGAWGKIDDALLNSAAE